MANLFKLIKVIIVLLLVILSGNFAANNQGLIAVDIGPLGESINIKLYLFTIIIFSLGFTIATMYFLMDSAKKTFNLRKQKKIIRKLETQCESLQSNPEEEIAIGQSFGNEFPEVDTDGTKKTISAD